MPSFPGITRIEIVQADELQDEVGNEVAHGGESRNPADDRKPAW